MQQGQRYSYGYDILPQFYQTESIHPVSLFFAPKSVDDVRLVPFTNTFGQVVSAETQKELFREFLSTQSELIAGEVSKRNGFRMPVNHNLDITSDLMFFVHGNRSHFINVGLTLQNVLAVVSKELAPVYFTNNHVVPVLNYEGTVFANNAPRQTFSYRHTTSDPKKIANNNPNLYNDSFRLWLSVSYNF